MAEHADRRVEDLLRAALRAEVSTLPVRVTAADVVRHQARLQGQVRHRWGWQAPRFVGLAATVAAVGALLLASVILGGTPTQPPTTLMPSPSSSLSPAPSVSPAPSPAPSASMASDPPTLAYTLLSNGQAELHLVDVDGTNDRVVGVLAADTCPISSPDRDLVAMGLGTDLVISATDGSDPRVIDLGEGGPPNGDIAWSPDGRWLLVARRPDRADTFGAGQIVMVETATGKVHRVELGARPSWSPDGSKLVFYGPTGREDGTLANWSIVLPGHGRCGDDRDERWNRHEAIGRWLRRRPTDLVVARRHEARHAGATGCGRGGLVSGSEVPIIPATTMDGFVGDASWSPDGRTIAVMENAERAIRPNGGRATDVARLSGGGASSSTAPADSAPGADSWPVWAPDGRYIADVAEEGSSCSASARSQRAS